MQNRASLDFQDRFHEPLMTLDSGWLLFFSQRASQLQLVVCIVVVLCSSHHFFLLEVLIFACVFNFLCMCVCLSVLCDCLGRTCSLTNPSNRWVKGLPASFFFSQGDLPLLLYHLKLCNAAAGQWLAGITDGYLFITTWLKNAAE